MFKYKDRVTYADSSDVTWYVEWSVAVNIKSALFPPRKHSEKLRIFCSTEIYTMLLKSAVSECSVWGSVMFWALVRLSAQVQ